MFTKNGLNSKHCITLRNCVFTGWAADSPAAWPTSHPSIIQKQFWCIILEKFQKQSPRWLMASRLEVRSAGAVWFTLMPVKWSASSLLCSAGDSRLSLRNASWASPDHNKQNAWVGCVCSSAGRMCQQPAGESRCRRNYNHTYKAALTHYTAGWEVILSVRAISMLITMTHI